MPKSTRRSSYDHQPLGQFEVEGRLEKIRESLGKTQSVSVGQAPKIARIGVMLDAYDWDRGASHCAPSARRPTPPRRPLVRLTRLQLPDGPMAQDFEPVRRSRASMTVGQTSIS